MYAICQLVSGPLLGRASDAPAAEPTEIRIGYLHLAMPKAAISLLDVRAENDGVAGAQLDTSGRLPKF